MKRYDDPPVDRLPPQSLEAQVGVLGSMLPDNQVIPDVARDLPAIEKAIERLGGLDTGSRTW